MSPEELSYFLKLVNVTILLLALVCLLEMALYTVSPKKTCPCFHQILANFHSVTTQIQ